jgi:hypothetical protein
MDLGRILVLALSTVLVAVPLGHAAATGWARLHHPALEGGGRVIYLRDVISRRGADPWLVVGYLVDSAGVRTPSVWSSRDGRSWARETMPDTDAPERRDGVHHVVRHGNVVVAIGDRFDGTLRPAAWRREGQGPWVVLPAATAPFVASRGTVGAVAETSTGFVVATVEHTENRSIVAIYTSVDGAQWVLHSFLPIGNDGFAPHGIAANPDEIVVVGDQAIGNESDGRIWVWRAGVWTKVDVATPEIGGPGFQQVATVVESPSGGYVAGGVVEKAGVAVPSIWISANGLEWQRLPDATVPVDGSGAAIHRVVVVQGGLLASGNSGGHPLLWQSTDGRSWSVVGGIAPEKPGLLVIAAADGSQTMLVVGREGGSRLLRSANGGAWTRADQGPAFPSKTSTGAELRDVASGSGRLIAVGTDGQGRPLVMLRARGSGWVRVPFDDPAARFEAIAANRGTFAIVGWRKLSGRARLAIWTSKNGRSWLRIGGTTAQPVGAFVDVAPDGKRFLAAALEGTQRGLITSVWNGDRTTWASTRILGRGDAQGVCVGPEGATAVATTGDGTNGKVLAWTRSGTGAGTWARESEVVATGALATRCAAGATNTVIAGFDFRSGAAVTWSKRPPASWSAGWVGNTSPRTEVIDIVRDGSKFVATGTIAWRGQADLGLWRSSDGIHWSMNTGLEPAFTEAGFQVGLGVVRDARGLVIVGRTGAGDAGLWFEQG